MTSTANESITIPTTGTGYDYHIDWGDGSAIEYNQTGGASHINAVAGTYTVQIENDFPRIFFNSSGDKDKLLTIEQWGTTQWTSMLRAFYGCSNLTIVATDAPDLSGVTSLAFMFNGASSLNSPLSNWDTSNVVSMSSMFRVASAFDQDLGSWDVTNVTSFEDMFQGVSLSNANYDSLLKGWSQHLLYYGVELDFGSSQYCEVAARETITSTYGWLLSDGGPNAPANCSDEELCFPIKSSNDSVAVICL